MSGIAIPPEGGERLQRGPRHHRVLCELPELEAVELSFGPDFEGVQQHTHSDHVDTFYVLEGEVEFVIDGRPHRFGPGGFVSSPVGTVHGFRNVGGGELRMLNIHAPMVGFIQGLRDD